MKRKKSASDSEEEWLPQEEARQRRHAARDPDEYYPSDEDMPDGYMAVSEYVDQYYDGGDSDRLLRWEDKIWVKRYNGRMAIYFKERDEDGQLIVQETMLATPTQAREESTNQGDENLTWHHTVEFIPGGKCLMQLVPTRYHAHIPHVGGVSATAHRR